MHQVVFEGAPVAQIILDRAGNVSLVNQQARALFGIEKDDIGRPIQDLQVSYRPIEIRSPIDEAVASLSTVAIHGVTYKNVGGQDAFYDIQIEPLTDVDGELIGINITYVDVSAAHYARIEVERSQHELETAYEELQATNEELETTNEELQSSVEEMETTNEELQSTNEELETLNEELQSTNDEFGSTSDELRRRTDDLNQSNDLMEGILTSLHGAVIVTDEKLAIQVWNYKAEDLWGLHATEVYGRLLTELDLGLPMDKLAELCRAGLDGKREPPTVMKAINRRGKEIMVRITCNQLRTRLVNRGGLLILMEEWHEEK
jgi:two-component system CheB/CheR fusion protein